MKFKYFWKASYSLLVVIVCLICHSISHYILIMKKLLTHFYSTKNEIFFFNLFSKWGKNYNGIMCFYSYASVFLWILFSKTFNYLIDFLFSYFILFILFKKKIASRDQLFQIIKKRKCNKFEERRGKISDIIIVSDAF